MGKLMVFKNANYNELEFDITPVRIVRKGAVSSDQSAIEMDKGFGDPSKPITDDLKNLETYLNSLSLNQTLLKANIDTVYDIEIDEAQWIADGLIFSSTKIFKDVEILDKLFEEFQKQHPSAAKNSGLISFLSPLRRDGAGGQGDLYDIDAKSFVIYNTNLSSKDSFAHEIGHVLGLKHSFHKYSQTRLNQYNLFVKQVDNRINYMFDNKYPENEITELWKDYKKDYADARGSLKTYYHYFKTKDVFKQATTENMMDYSNEKDAQKNIIQTNNNSRISFWKYQWDIMQ
ncbi:hypothetical protein [Mesonia algae]|nr:hypothetical protein [Mesonia algae]